MRDPKLPQKDRGRRQIRRGLHVLEDMSKKAHWLLNRVHHTESQEAHKFTVAGDVVYVTHYEGGRRVDTICLTRADARKHAQELRALNPSLFWEGAEAERCQARRRSGVL